jgi:hypothetical protein
LQNHFENRVKLGKNKYQGTSATTSGWLNILAALHLLFVGIGSPAGV